MKSNHSSKNNNCKLEKAEILLLITKAMPNQIYNMKAENQLIYVCCLTAPKNSRLPRNFEKNKNVFAGTINHLI